MMKKIFVLLCMVLYNLYCFAADYRVIKDSKLYDGNYYYRGNIKKGTLVQLWDTFISDGTNLSGNIVDFDYCCTINWYGEKRLIDLEAIVPAETKDLFDPDIVTTSLRKNGKYWTYVEDCDVLFSRDRKTYYEKNKAAIDYYEQKVRGSYDGPWYEGGVPLRTSGIYNVALILCKEWRVSLFVKNIEKTKKGYKIVAEISNTEVEEYEHDYKFLKETFIVGSDITLILHIDGDYLSFYTETNHLVVTCVLVDDVFKKQYRQLIANNTCDLSRVTWPRHADGSCDYETINKLQQGKRCRASDNLRLRSSGSTAGKPVVTIGKGTQVKVLAVGAEQTIDGITSNWVQVEVQAGAKDRDGKAIAAGTRGWCFGGYLK
ncbi:SH3 domain-containing protein [Treponema socranskii subsp. buccale]|uniref:SH3 domain-containing protein n=1 Tax=Treponema socranskii TaxID=53419 RepID=UPI0020A47C3B|nr:SH3 domain-containing protein [Treponema socranskii]UTD03118.1 SH3 domain-containing protein [Treponema socranskii subsp. buccale]